jgi:hypothetical protein
VTRPAASSAGRDLPRSRMRISRVRRFTVAVTTAFAAAAVAAASAAADGLPVLGVDVGSSGVTVSGSAYRYLTLRPGAATIVERTARTGGRLLAFDHVDGNFTIPAVAYDGSASGLSADGSTLVLIEPRASFPRTQTRLAVLDARSLHLERLIRLRGDFSFDAVSPHGRTMFLIQYTDPSDPSRYSVRAYDLRAGTLLPGAIVDPAEHDDAMRGAPITRTTSSDGRFAYTLYDGAGGTPFVHALDTSTRSAHCIDLPMLAGLRNLWSLKLGRGPGGMLRVSTPAATLAVVDTTTFVASLPPTGTSSDGRPWLLASASAAALGLLLLAAALRRYHGRLAVRPVRG